MMERALTKSKWRKAAVAAAAGAVVGALAMAVVIPFVDSGAIPIAGPSEAAAAGVGLIYLLIAVSIAVGLASPRLGAQFLNMEDEEELRQQRRMTAYATASMAATGGALLTLVFAAPGGSVPRLTALAVTLALFAATVPLTLLQWRHMDELMRAISTETGNLSFYLILLVGGGWTMLAQLNFVPPPAPLDWLTMLFALALIASFIVVGRRGMLLPR